MLEYQWNVAIDGKHVFRTDWYDSDIERIRKELHDAFVSREGASLTETTRTKTMRSRELF